MNFKSFALMLCFAPVLCGAEHVVINQSFVPDKTNRAYTVMVEAGAKLLEFDIIRARVNAQEKALVADLQKEQFTSAAGKALGVLGPLEQLAHGFDDVIPAFLILQNSVTEAATTDAVKTQISKALNGLVALLAEPEVLHAVLPQPELVGAQYRDAMTFAPTATFIKTIQAIAHKKCSHHYCNADNSVLNDQGLSEDERLFYAVVKRTVENLFKSTIEEKISKIAGAVVYVDESKIATQALEYLDLQKRIVDLETYFADYQNLLSYRRINNFIDKQNKETLENSVLMRKNRMISKVTAIRDQVAKKFEIAAGLVAQSKGAAAISFKKQFVYVDPVFDITVETIDQLNKEYKKVISDSNLEEYTSLSELFDPQNLLQISILNNSADGIHRAIEAGADVNKEIDGQTPLIMAIQCNYSNCDRLNAVKELVASKANINVSYYGYTPLRLALTSGLRDSAQIALLLVQHGVNVDDGLKEIWRISSTSTFFELLELLLARGLDINDLWSKLLSDGYIFNNPNNKQIFDYFVKHGANPNQIFDFLNGRFVTPLATAIRLDHFWAIEMLLNAGADINQPFKPHYFELHCQRTHSNRQSCKHKPGEIFTCTPLAYAQELNRTEIVKLLIERGASY